VNAATMTDRELDALVAKAFGDRKCDDTHETPSETHKWYPDDAIVWVSGPVTIGGGHTHVLGGGITMCKPRRYSRDIEAAWSVVEEMRRRGWRPSMQLVEPNSLGPQCWLASFGTTFPEDRAVGFGSHTDTLLPRAICVAALRALGVTA